MYTLPESCASKFRTSGAPAPVRDDAFRGEVLRMKEPVGTLKWKGGEPFGAEQPSAYSDIHFVIFIPEPYILQNLPFFQKMLYYWIPLLSVAVVAGYSNANYGLLWKNEMRAYLNSLTVKLVLGGSSCLCSDHPPEEAR